MAGFDLENTGADSKTLKGLTLDGRYKITEVIGEGAMGRVYSGVQVSVARKVAIKVIRSELSNDPQLRRRFLQEAKTMATFSHPNIVGLLDFGDSADGLLYAVLEFVEGKPLADLVGGNQMSVEFVLVLANQIAAALAEAHSHNVIHRDLKPDNVLVTRVAHGAVRFRLVDFGIARPIEDNDATMEEGIYGTPTYLSPEQAKARPPVPQSDFYGLGAILYEMLVGEPVFEFRTVVQIVLSHANETAPDVREKRPDVPSDVAEFIAMLLAKTPEERPANAVDLMEVIEDLQVEYGIRNRLRTQKEDLREFYYVSEFERLDTMQEMPAYDAGPDDDFLVTGNLDFDEPAPSLRKDGLELSPSDKSEVELVVAHTVISTEVPRAEVDAVMGALDFDGPESEPLMFRSEAEEAEPEIERPEFKVRPPPPKPSKVPLVLGLIVVVLIVAGLAFVFTSSDEPSDTADTPPPAANSQVNDPEPQNEIVDVPPLVELPTAEETQAIVFGRLKKAKTKGWRFSGQGTRRTDEEETSSFLMEKGGDKVLVSFTFSGETMLDEMPPADAPEVSYRHNGYIIFLGPVSGAKVPWDLKEVMKKPD